jgi:hypothetical protein
MNDKLNLHAHSEFLLDEALEETFPASDPISPAVGAGQPVENAVGEKPVKPSKKSVIPGVPDARSVTLDANAVWDAQYGMFRIRINDSPEFAAIMVLGSAPLPLTHLSRRESSEKSLLGPALHDRLQYEVNGAIARGAHQVATGIMLMTHQEMKSV